MKRTGMTADEVRRFNPALDGRVPAQSALYLPLHVGGFGEDVAFWPPGAALVSRRAERLHASRRRPRALGRSRRFAPVLSDFKRRFRSTGTEEVMVMDTVRAYVMDQACTSGRRTLIAEFRGGGQVRRLLIDQGRLEPDVVRDAQARMIH